jgi:hypothetical protein
MLGRIVSWVILNTSSFLWDLAISYDIYLEKEMTGDALLEKGNEQGSFCQNAALFSSL